MFGKRLAALRKQKGISQYKLAEDLGLSRGQLANYEVGSREPDFETLFKIAKYFDVTTDYILGYSDNQKATRSIPVLDYIKSDILLLANEPTEYLDIPQNLSADYAIIMNDTSMIEIGILAGDFIICLETTTSEPGQIVITLNGSASKLSEAIVKYHPIAPNESVSESANIYIAGSDSTDDSRIVGVATALLRKDMNNGLDSCRNQAQETQEWKDIMSLSNDAGLKVHQVREILLAQIDIAEKLGKK